MNNKTYKYGSFNRPLDFIYDGDISQPFEIGHNPLPIKPSEPFSWILVKNPLTADEIYRYQLKLVEYDKYNMCLVKK